MKISYRWVLVTLLLAGANSALAQDATAPEGAAPATTEAAPAPAASEAPAAAPASSSAKKISAGLLLGYGISLESGSNPWGLGFGLRGGYNLDKIFLGARFIYFLGKDPVNIWELGVEGGYDFLVADKLTVRPTLGIGMATMTVSVPSVTYLGTTIGGGSASSTEFYIAPGASVLYDIDDSWFIGGEARLQLVTSSPMVKSISILANGGMRF